MDAAGDLNGNSEGNIRGRGLQSAFRRRAIRSFWRKEHGGAALESALAISLAVAAFAALMEIVDTVFESDRMHRAARAVAQATALDPNADACAAIRGELGLANNFDFTAWKITVHRSVLPSKLSDTLVSASAGGTGDMVLVRIGWSHDAWPLQSVVPAANASGTPATCVSRQSEPARPRIAIGLARSEPRG